MWADRSWSSARRDTTVSRRPAAAGPASGPCASNAGRPPVPRLRRPTRCYAAGSQLVPADVRARRHRRHVLLRDPVWTTNFRLHHRAATLTAGRTFLAGDAAHIHSAAGARGMNTRTRACQDRARLHLPHRRAAQHPLPAQPAARKRTQPASPRPAGRQSAPRRRHPPQWTKEHPALGGDGARMAPAAVRPTQRMGRRDANNAPTRQAPQQHAHRAPPRRAGHPRRPARPARAGSTPPRPHHHRRCAPPAAPRRPHRLPRWWDLVAEIRNFYGHTAVLPRRTSDESAT